MTKVNNHGDLSVVKEYRYKDIVYKPRVSVFVGTSDEHVNVEYCTQIQDNVAQNVHESQDIA